MPDSYDDLKAIIEKLTSDIRSLSERVESLERTAQGASGDKVPQVRSEPVQTISAAGPEKESALSVGGVAALMSRGAVISLILLLALVLRTLTDNGALGMGIGTALGIGYATLLEGMGWFMYRRKSPFAPILSISGALLLAAVVLETHASFGSISTLPAYLLLAVAGGGMAVISRQYKAAIPVSVGTMAVLLAGVSMGFPETNFPALALFLAAVNIMAFTAVTLPKARWLRIVTFFITTIMILLWGYKLRFALLSESRPDFEALLASPELFFAVVGFYLCFYVAYATLAIWRDITDIKRPFDHLLPSLTAAWAYLASLLIVQASGTNVRILGAAGVLAATCLLGLAAIKGSRTGTGSRGTTTFAFPAAMLLALSFRDVSGQSVFALAILSWGALSLAWLSSRWSSAGVRVTGYILQGTVLGAAFLLLLMSPAGRAPSSTVLGMVVITGVAFVHYLLTRRNEPPGQNPYFTRFDKSDVSGVIPLLVSVGALFLAVRGVLFTMTEGSGWIYQAGETIIINAGALALFAAAKFRRNAEIKWVAVLVTAMGGGKVFLYDLFQIKGLPVVLSVLSFVIAAAFGSWVLSRWQRMVGEQ